MHSGHPLAVLPRLLLPSPYQDNFSRHPSNREMMYWSFSSPGPSAANLAEGRRPRCMGVSDAATPLLQKRSQASILYLLRSFLVGGEAFLRVPILCKRPF